MDGIIASFACRRINTAHPMILVTGGAGFIGANFVLDWIANGDEPVVNLDKLTYAGNLHNLDSVQGNPRHIFVQGDIGDTALLERLLAEHQPRAIVNFAAESHVDRSIHGPEDFIQTNVVGTFRLLEAARQYWQALPAIKKEAFRFLHVSTDEVYGTLSATDPAFSEDNRYEPNSPYSASKAASELINQLMAAVIEGVRDNPVLRHKLFQIDYLTTLSDQAVVSMLYHKKLDDEWRKEAEALRDALRAQNLNVHLIGRATKTKIELDQDYIDERLPVAGKEIIYRQVENSFTQPNAAMNIQMLEWAIDVTRGSKGDLLELYCGNGNFSLALAQNFNRVLATEIAKPSVAAAQYNIAANHIDNVQIIRMAAEEFTQAMNGVREFNRLQGIDLKSYQCETIFVDPPRSGLDSETEKMVQAYPRILYISCNPETLCKNLETLSQTHKVERLALFDQFPYTHHMECGVLLTAK